MYVYKKQSSQAPLWTSTQNSDEHFVRFNTARVTLVKFQQPLYGFSGGVILLATVSQVRGSFLAPL